MTGFRKRLKWFVENRPDLSQHLAFREVHCPDGSSHEHRLLAIPQAPWEHYRIGGGTPPVRTRADAWLSASGRQLPRMP